LKVGLASLWARVKQVVTTDPSGSDEDDLVVDEAAAHAMARQAGRLKGGYAKVAQLAAYDPSASLRGSGDHMSLVAQRILGELWDHAPAESSLAVAQVIEQDFGKSPTQLFATWDPQPLAAASLGQVHAATGHDGQSYVVKVQYPHVAKALTADLADSEFVRKLAGAHVGRTLDESALQRLADAVRSELDYRLEAEALADFGTRWNSDAVLRIPTVNRELSSGRVLTMQRATGVTIAESATRGSDASADRNTIASALFRFTWGTSLRDGVFNADPNPGNFLVDNRNNQPVVWCLDFGCVAKLSDAIRDGDRQLWWGLMEPDAEFAAEKFRMGLSNVGLLARTDSMASNAHREWEQALLRPYQRGRSFVWDRAYSKELSDTTQRALAHGGLALPADLILLWRQRLGAAAVLGMIGGAFDASAQLRELIGSGKVALR
jgi:predicted unusual protein kinase regulating ubiquinone biosynthesis (AarF/ABC1/UbiB family)